ncbi:OmpH family outer membrane protein [Mesonia maritima]|uniref:Skp family chaperone for outer membrane proteins n=1 Tax=Mesonia maritima TaxID=1793873 RepID=A0ABU1K3K7_9FLAO|nr:OmpH family outer membrane protein [Mesonia maritima]MDR6300199.1 Skp family chaperone for outer membrane proteins [Mesonia maritima]
MKKSLLILLIGFISSFQLQAQRGLKIGYVDMDYILDNVPEYKQASQQLSGRVQQWKAEIESKMQKVKDMKQNLENERPLLTKELIEEREEEIKYEEDQIVKYQQDKFGPQGAFITQKRQLIQPVQDQVFNAVQEIGQTREYDFIYENSADALMLFSAKRHDISDQILAKITRSSRKLEREEQTENKEGEDENAAPEEYKSVIQAKEDKIEEQQREEKRQAIEDKRENEMNERQRVRDSIREAKRLEYEQRRQKMLEERQQRRDSIEKARNAERNNN